MGAQYCKGCKECLRNQIIFGLQPKKAINTEKIEIIYHKNKVGDKIRLFGSNLSIKIKINVV